MEVDAPPAPASPPAPVEPAEPAATGSAEPVPVGSEEAAPSPVAPVPVRSEEATPVAPAPPVAPGGPLDAEAISTLERELADVGRALERLDAGTYGTCEVCGASIDDARLAHHPATATCEAHAPRR